MKTKMTNAERVFSLLSAVMFELSEFDTLECPDTALCSYVEASVRMLHRAMLRACTLCLPSSVRSKYKTHEKLPQVSPSGEEAAPPKRTVAIKK